MGEHLFRRGKTWYGWVYGPSGEQIKFSTGCTDKAAARIVLAQRERENADPDTARKKSATLGSAIALLIADRKSLVQAGKRSEATISFYETCARSWYLYAGRKITRASEEKLDRAFTSEERENLIELGMQLALADAADERFVDAFIVYRRANGVTENTISKDRTTFRAALRLAKRARIWSGDLDLLFPRGFDAGYTPNRSFLTREQGGRLLDAFLAVPTGPGEGTVSAPHRRAFLTSDRPSSDGGQRASWPVLGRYVACAPPPLRPRPRFENLSPAPCMARRDWLERVHPSHGLQA